MRFVLIVFFSLCMPCFLCGMRKRVVSSKTKIVKTEKSVRYLSQKDIDRESHNGLGQFFLKFFDGLKKKFTFYKMSKKKQF